MFTIKQFYRADEMAEILGLTRAGVYKMAKDGIIPHHKIGHSMFFPKSFIENMLKEDLGKEKVKEV